MNEPSFLPLPHDTRTTASKEIVRCQNLGLLFARYIRYRYKDSTADLKEYNYEQRHNGKWRTRSSKLYALEEIAKQQVDADLYKAIVARWELLTCNARRLDAIAEWRVVTGVGLHTPVEIGCLFQRIHGYPYLAGSGLKGLARTAAIFEIAETLKIKTLPLDKSLEYINAKSPRVDELPLQKLEAALLAFDHRIPDKDTQAQSEMSRAEQKCLSKLGLSSWGDASNLVTQFREAFGTQYAAGSAIFFDGLPEGPRIKVDILNPHYKDYYGQGKVYPTDDQDPSPNFFLTLAPGAKFMFAVGWRGSPNNDAWEKAIKWLKVGLTDLGAGAKTNAGYGYFTEIEDVPHVSPPEPSVQITNMPPALTSTSIVRPPQSVLLDGSGRLKRKGNRIWIQESERKTTVTKEFLGDSYNQLPGDGTDVTYQYDEVEGERRIWTVTRKPNFGRK
jgi:CRISPR-associated protein Cmr6